MTRNQRFEPQQPTSYHKQQQERAMREAYRREKKIESYLADDENFPSFAMQLRKLGLALRDIPADGNCLFRALGDQLEGHSRNHYKHRHDIVNYMIDHRKDFEPFVEDDMTFDEHVNNLRKLGTHAGNDAIVAFAKLHDVNIMIHQLNGKPLLIQGPSNNENVAQLHIAYHNGDHYSSIRRDGDNTESPANIRLQDEPKKPCLHVPPSGLQPYSGGGMSGVVTARRGLDHLEGEVVRATGCHNIGLVKEILHDCDYDVDATIATMLQTLEVDDSSNAAGDTTSLESRQTEDSGIWAENGTGSRIFGGGVASVTMNGKGQKVHFRDDSLGGSSGYGSMSSSKGGGARPKLPIAAVHSHQAVYNGHKSKDVKKMEKKMRASERHRQRVSGIDPRQQYQHPIQHEGMMIIKHDITRI